VRTAALRRRGRRAVLRHRRPIAAVLLAAAVVVAVVVARPPAPRTVPVAVAARDLAGGLPLADEDVATVLVEPDLVPHGAYSPGAVPLGRIVAGPVRRGLPLTDAAVVGPGLAAQLADGDVLVTVHVRDPAASIVEAGDLVRVIATDPRGSATAVVVADAARVVTIPSVNTAAGGGTSPLVLAVPEPTALALSGAATSQVLDVVVPAPGAR
jgi:Flp pilus assembly protein CpaB